MEISSELLKILVCPVTQDKLIYNREKEELVSLTAGLAYPVNDGIPMLLQDYGRRLTKEEISILQISKSRLLQNS